MRISTLSSQLTQNADIALARAEEKLIDAFEGAAKKLREEGLHLHA